MGPEGTPPNAVAPLELVVFKIDELVLQKEIIFSKFFIKWDRKTIPIQEREKKSGLNVHLVDGYSHDPVPDKRCKLPRVSLQQYSNLL